MIQEKILKIENKNFPLFKEQMKWKGEGTTDDPVVINSMNETYTQINFYDITNHMTIRNLKDKTLGFKHCANTSIENCKITHLALIECKKMKISNNVISSVSSLHSGECAFKRNTILKESFEKLKKGYYNRKHLKNFIFFNSIFIYGLGSFLYALIKIPIEAFEMFNTYLLMFLMLLPLFLIFFPKPLVRIVRSWKYPPHEFENNSIINQEQFNLSFPIQ